MCDIKPPMCHVQPVPGAHAYAGICNPRPLLTCGSDLMLITLYRVGLLSTMCGFHEECSTSSVLTQPLRGESPSMYFFVTRYRLCNICMQSEQTYVNTYMRTTYLVPRVLG